MVEIKSELFAEPKEGQSYDIKEAKEITVKSSDGKNEYPAISVVMLSTDKTDKSKYTVTLWLTDNASSTSKLGSFMLALGNDTDKWLGKTIRIRSWRNKIREIEVV